MLQANVKMNAAFHTRQQIMVCLPVCQLQTLSLYASQFMHTCMRVHWGGGGGGGGGILTGVGGKFQNALDPFFSFFSFKKSVEMIL